MPLTPAQQLAISTEGNVLVEAGAGAGKTSTLVERCLQRVLDENDPVSLDRILMVTFTEAAAAEMRQRIREALENKSAAHPENGHLAEQLALLDSARICTLHGFCLQLVREHFYELELDPQLTVLDEAQSRLLAEETLETVLQRHYAGQTPNAGAVQQLILKQARGWDGPIRDLVLRLHEYTQARPDPEGWLAKQKHSFARYDASGWENWLFKGLAEWRADWLAALRNLPTENSNAQQCLSALRNLPENPTRAQATTALAQILIANDNWPKGKKGEFSAPLRALFADAGFLQPLVDPDGDRDPLMEDWSWVRAHMTALLELTREFSSSFDAAKRESGALDFHDLEQFALRLLWDALANRPTPIALDWREKLRLVFVDEYQDINAAQDKIIQCLGREGAATNRFLVGDVKQSIYRFRLADPHIFQNYKAEWSTPTAPGRIIPLTDNFRSHESILHFVNALFASLMRSEVGGVDYDEAAKLRFGSPQERKELSQATDATPRVELLLRLTGKEESESEEELENGLAHSSDVTDLSNAEMEARLIALRLRELKDRSFQTWDSRSKKYRAVDWRDMVVLLRSPRNKAESFAKEFARLGVPLEAARGGFFDTPEVSDLLSLLLLLDNPLQDVPVLAVLRSPLVSLSLDELATIRLELAGEPFWKALEQFHCNVANSKSPARDDAFAKASEQAWPKVDAFLKSFAAWRRLARQSALSHCLEAVLDETHYEDWLRAQPRGEAKRANVQRLLGMTRQFDQFQRQGLFRFLKFIETQQKVEEDREPARAETGDAVQLMSVHKSKGLEFPVVVVGGLGGLINFADIKADIILDEEYGLCPHVHPPETEQRYPSLPYWLAGKRQKRETLGEELRLLYVAMTRARDKLILTGTATRKSAEGEWQNITAAQPGTQQILAAKRYLDWIGPLAPRLTGNRNWLAEPNGRSQLLEWRLVEDDYVTSADRKVEGEKDLLTHVDPMTLESLRSRLAWQYPHRVATEEPAKTSVSAVRRRLAEETEEEVQPFFRFQRETQPAITTMNLSSAEVGIAHHTFLQFVSLDCVDGVAALASEGDRLEREQILTSEQKVALNLPALASFWASETGRKIRANVKHVQRELSFTARFSPRELSELVDKKLESTTEDEFVVVQGVADLVVLLPDEIWLLDFKTDHFADGELADKVKLYEPQIKLYAAALGRIYRRPVTECWLYFLALSKTVECPPRKARSIGP